MTYRTTNPANRPDHRCTTCGEPAARPRRVYGGGVTEPFFVVEGCVDAAHDAWADAWHLRPEAAAIRATAWHGVEVTA